MFSPENDPWVYFLRNCAFGGRQVSNLTVHETAKKEKKKIVA